MYLICLFTGTLPCASPADSTPLFVASYLYGTNVTWTYGYLENLAPDGACEIDIASLVVVLVCGLFFLVVNFLAQVK